MVYGDIVLWAVFGPVALVAFAFTVRAVIGWRGLRAEAVEDFAYRRRESMIAPDVTETRFTAAYMRANAPRTSTYAAATLWTVLLATPVIAKILEVLLQALWQLSGRSRVVEPGYLVWAFMIFFGLLGSWALIAFIAARRFHGRAPGRLDEELRRDA